LEVNGSPNFGTQQIRAGFLPDPIEIEMTSGGSVSVAHAIGMWCDGYATSAPDFRVVFDGDGHRLRFFFVPSEGPNVPDADTVLVINDPTGTWYCNDDSYDTRAPTIDIDPAWDGAYDIWVASLRSGNYVRGILVITETDLSPADYAGSIL
jgi:hypothetical protein